MSTYTPVFYDRGKTDLVIRYDNTYTVVGGGGGGGTPASTVTGPPAFGASPVVGTGTNYAREDHVHGLPSLPVASTTVQGIVELATSADTAAGLAVQASDTRLSDARTPSGSAGGDLGGTYPNPTVEAVNSSSAVQWQIGTITEGQPLVALGGVIQTGGHYITDWKTWATGKTTSLTAGEHAGPDFTLVVGTYVIWLVGSCSSSGSATGPRPFVRGTGGLVTSNVRLGVQVFSAATTLLSAQSNNVTGTVPTINNGSTTEAGFCIWGFLTVTTGGTLEVWIASETGGTNVTLHHCHGYVHRVS